jgi:membrane-associated phospholipid phosphatase
MRKSTMATVRGRGTATERRQMIVVELGPRARERRAAPIGTSKSWRTSLWWRVALGVVGVLIASAALMPMETLIGHDVRQVDMRVAVEAHAFTARERVAHVAAQTVTFFGSTVWLMFMVAGLAICWIRSGRRYAAGLLLAVSIGSAIVCRAIKILVERERPHFAPALADPHGSSFPSGHTMQSVAIYGVLLAIMLPSITGRTRWIVVPLVVSFIASIAVSRVLLGVHYVSDITVGAVLGTLWLMLVALTEPAILDRARRTRHRRKRWLTDRQGEVLAGCNDAAGDGVFHGEVVLLDGCAATSTR